MNTTDKIDAARIELLLGELRLPGIKLIWAALAETADKEGWPAARFLAALAEQEMVERSRRRFERHLEEARLPPGKTLDAFDFDAVPMISKAQVQALAGALLTLGTLSGRQCEELLSCAQASPSPAEPTLLALARTHPLLFGCVWGAMRPAVERRERRVRAEAGRASHCFTSTKVQILTPLY